MRIFNDHQVDFYQEKFSQEQISDEAQPMISLIPDDLEYREQFIDYRLQWISDNDPHSPLKNFHMVDCQCEMNFFLNRKQELTSKRAEHIYQLKQQYERELQEFQTTEPPNSVVRQTGPIHLIDYKTQEWRGQAISAQEKKCHEHINSITDRYNSLQEQCDERIHQARANYQEAFRFWKEEHGL